MKIYIAAPLFSDAERTWNVALRDRLLAWGYDTYLPQEDGEIAFSAIKKKPDIVKVRKRVFENDIKEVKQCDLLLCVLDGRAVDEGVCIELGIAYTLGKPCIGYKTDFRSL